MVAPEPESACTCRAYLHLQNAVSYEYDRGVHDSRGASPHCQELCRHAVSGWGQTYIDLWDAEAAAHTFATLGTNLKGVSPDVQPLSLLLVRLAKFLRNVPADISSKEHTDATIEEWIDPL